MPDELRQDAALSPQRHGGAGEVPAAGAGEERRADRHRRRVLHGRRHRQTAGDLRPGQKVRGTGHGGRRPRPGRSGQLLRPGGPGGHLYGHVFQVPGVPGRLHGGLGGGGGLCAPRVPALHLLGVHSPGQLRHGPGGPAAPGAASRAAGAAAGAESLCPQGHDGPGHEDPGVRPDGPHAHHPHLYL